MKILSANTLSMRTGEKISIDGFSLGEGTYLLQLESCDGISVKKFVVSRQIEKEIFTRFQEYISEPVFVTSSPISLLKYFPSN